MYVGVAVLWPVRQTIVHTILTPPAVIRLVRKETLANLLLQFAQVTPASIVLAAPDKTNNSNSITGGQFSWLLLH